MFIEIIDYIHYITDYCKTKKLLYISICFAISKKGD